jgi:hypothetical protein
LVVVQAQFVVGALAGEAPLAGGLGLVEALAGRAVLAPGLVAQFGVFRQGALEFTLNQLNRLGNGLEVTNIPWGSKRFNLPPSSLK